jgi:dihydropteroate synthase
MSRSSNEVSKHNSERLILRGQTLFLSKPVVMGVLNVTPDSFSDGGKFNTITVAVERIEEMQEEGATIIDIGGESTRPGAPAVSAEEEIDRVLPVLEQALGNFPNLFFSVDTTKFEVARRALEAGAHIINDISGLQKEPRLAGLCADFNAGYILMHSQGNPQTMQDNPTYNDVIADITTFFNDQLAVAADHGLTENIILDPGFGFGKTLNHNLTIATHLEKFLSLGFPILTGASRKSMIGTVLGNRNVEGRLFGTVAFHYDNLLKGAKIIRVHDVRAAADSVSIYNALHS